METRGWKWINCQKGKAESKAPLIITVILLLVALYISYKFVPVKWRNMKFQQRVEDILNIDYAREYKDIARGAFNEYTMRERVLAAAKKLGIPIKDADRQVTVLWPEGKIFTVKVDYTEEINLPIYGIYQWKFHVYIEQDPHAGKAISE